MDNQPGYLWGLNRDEPTVVGQEDGWHWRAQAGIAIPYWSLYYGDREIGFHSFPIHEQTNWPRLLESMVEGLSRAFQHP